MIRLFLAVCIVALGCFGASAQKTNDAIRKQIKGLHADKSISVTVLGNASKLMGVASNFSDADTRSAGVQAMNLVLGFFYNGQQLDAAPDIIDLTFRVLSKQPRFAPAGKWTVTLPSGDLDLGEFRYASKARDDMEYLNFKVKRDDLAKIAASPSSVAFRLGPSTFTFTSEQMQLLRNFVAVSDSK